MGLLRSDLEPYTNILSGDQLSDLSQLSTNQGAQERFLSNNEMLDQIRGDVNEASFRTDVSGVAPTPKSSRPLGGFKPDSPTGGHGGLEVPSGIGTDDIISRVFLGAGNDLINQQINRQLPLLSTGQSSAAQAATGSGNLLTGAGNAAAAGTIGAANAQAQGSKNTASMIGMIASLFSDERLKTNIQKTGEHKGLNVYTWDWNEKGAELGLHGSSSGHIAQEVQKIHPDLISNQNGYLMINYGTYRTVK